MPGATPWSHRWIGNPILTGILNWFFRVRVSDAHCGLRAVRRDALPKLKLSATRDGVCIRDGDGSFFLSVLGLTEHAIIRRRRRAGRIVVEEPPA